MTKSELIAELSAANPHLLSRDVETIVATIFNEITAALSRGERVELRGFGAFTICLLYTSPSPRDRTRSRMPSSA